jgi:hypothetical protein
MKPYYFALPVIKSDADIRHHSLADAQAEAERLASKYPDKTYEILKCVGIASCSKASTFWMDGEGPEPVGMRYFVGLTGYTAWRANADGPLYYANQDSEGWMRSAYENPQDLMGTLAGIREITAAELPEGIKP